MSEIVEVAPVETEFVEAHGTNTHTAKGRLILRPRTAPVLPNCDSAQLEMATRETNRKAATPTSKVERKHSEEDDELQQVAKTPDAGHDFVGSRYDSALGEKSQGIFVPWWVMKIATTKAQLLVLSQFGYWFGTARNSGLVRAKVQRGGHWWVYKTYRNLGLETNLTEGQVRAAVRALIKIAVLIIDTDPDIRGPVHYRLNPIAIERIVDSVTPER